MSTSVEVYATRDSMVGVIRWIGGNSSYNLIKHWAKRNADLDSAGNLLLQTEDGVLTVPRGDYIVKVGKSFDIFTPAELEELYVKVESE